MTKNNIINEWLDKNNDPVIERLVKRNLAIANKVRNILSEKGLSDKEFASMLNKTPSEISKWLSGTHNFTGKTIIKMEIALGERLIHIEPIINYVYLDVIRGGLKDKKKYTQGDYNTVQPAYAS
ncbi:helix-turn-helix transcriptional regulator [Flagellimonas halotolerans]|uniref:Helix-turn-helix transcriptional regulator n=1 Tax=Flagellimonas halotolerans TaxID=3112164 RepID=A0ABU6IQQ8_9FLAO|nr:MULTISPECIES: helix-turn-helix transcriptional regulator [unclassified Allomuricauda]MEC3965589.1 helix-turn-helix transcriptional regulator [Muricauda sp. SYSU M86414]MEC4265455.1 helix-turn-helix transcriptional regulator [Muricauda sp. SYSU M84420]